MMMRIAMIVLKTQANMTLKNQRTRVSICQIITILAQKWEWERQLPIAYWCKLNLNYWKWVNSLLRTYKSNSPKLNLSISTRLAIGDTMSKVALTNQPPKKLIQAVSGPKILLPSTGNIPTLNPTWSPTPKLTPSITWASSTETTFHTTSTTLS